MTLLSWIILGVALGGFFALFLFLKKQMEREIEGKFSKISQEALKSSNEQFLLLAKQALESQGKQATADLESKKQAVETSIKGLKDELEKYRNLIREFEQDRAKKY